MKGGRLSLRRWCLPGIIYLLIWQGVWFGATALGTVGNAVSLWNPLAGLRFFLLVAFGWGAAPLALLAEVSLMSVAWGISHPEFSLPLSWIDRLAGMLSPLVAYGGAALALRAWGDRRAAPPLADPTATSGFLVMAFIGSLAAAGLGTAQLLRAGSMTAEQTLNTSLNGLISDFIGILTLTPLLLWHLEPRLKAWLEQRSPPVAATRLSSSQRLWIGLAYLAGLLLMLLVALFHAPHPPGWTTKTQLFLLLFLLIPLAAGVLVGGLAVATLAIVVLNAGLAWGTDLPSYTDAALERQWAMITVAVTGLLLGSFSDAHRRAVAKYRDLSWLSNDLLWTTDAKGWLRKVQGQAGDCALRLDRPWWRSLRALPMIQRAQLRIALQAGQPFRDLIVQVRVPGGGGRWWQINGQPYYDHFHRIAGYQGAATDVTLRYQAQQVLHEYTDRLQREVAAKTADLWRAHRQLMLSERRYRTMLATAPLGVAEVDRHGCNQYINYAWCLLLDQPNAEALLGQPWWTGLPADAGAEIVRLWSTRRLLGVGNQEFQGPRERWLGVQWSLLDHPDGGSAGALVILTDLTHRHQREQEQWRLAHLDALTQLPNRRLFGDRLEQALRQAQRQGRLVAVLWLDLDGFKAVNDTLGHAAGDELLRQVGQRLQTGLRESDTAARLGGDEFAVVLTTIAHPGDATHVAQKLIEVIGQTFSLPQGLAQVSTSIGVALYPYHAGASEDLAQRADAAMYAAKRAGKNRWRVWQSTENLISP